MNRKHSQFNPSHGIAACAISVTAANEIQLFPAGQFRATDGRPHDVPHWFIDAALAAQIIAEFEARANRTVVDYEHQTLLAAQNGQPAPAAGWFGKLAWRESGLYAVDVEWTERATQMIEGGEYRYISPVFTYDKKTGKVKRLLHAALTNNPALDGMDAVAASQFFNQEKLNMDQLLEQLRWLLNMPVTATVDEVVTELQKAIDQLKGSNPAIATKVDFNLVALVQSLNSEIASLKTAANHPDPSGYATPGAVAATPTYLGSVEEQVDNTGGADGAKTVNVRCKKAIKWKKPRHNQRVFSSLADD
ncbi:Mu-like prophage I protein [Nitrosomonas nitrosa]|uniref:Mu-like prophage I protein n=1 Tax=Nitrosomonas nitrosa TaxID=52442 RepID=A0A1I4SS70_9PROT|nr:phage protease [Nitrosomonas nitrosa]SFM67282.1 Mu-like prophage I protein [Nitrosomonas nitrosa]